MFKNVKTRQIIKSLGLLHARRNIAWRSEIKLKRITYEMLTFHLNFWFNLAMRENYNLEKIDDSEIHLSWTKAHWNLSVRDDEYLAISKLITVLVYSVTWNNPNKIVWYRTLSPKNAIRCWKIENIINVSRLIRKKIWCFSVFPVELKMEKYSAQNHGISAKFQE